jgi:hypothetical protein
MKYLYILVLLGLVVGLGACDPQNSDEIQQHQQEQILKEGTSQVGMPSIKNFRERKLLKDIIEMRDQEGLNTWTYTYSEITGKKYFFCNSIGYGLPYATQFTNPQKAAYQGLALPQADPNGLFSPASAEGTWVMCKDPNSDKVAPVYVEPRVIVSPFSLHGEGEDNK